MTARNGSSPPSIHRPKPIDRDTYYNNAMQQVVEALTRQHEATEKDADAALEARCLKRDAQRGDGWRRQHA